MTPEEAYRLLYGDEQALRCARAAADPIRRRIGRTKDAEIARVFSQIQNE